MTNKKIILDSGAFSAHSRGINISLDDYISYCKDHHKLFCEIVALDVIPGGGVSAERAARRSFRNTCKMRDAGLTVVPVYHYGEKTKHLIALLDAGFEKVGLGGIARSMQGEVRDQWIRRCFKRIEGRAKVHGFGISGVDTVRQHGWASVDSASWAIEAGMGNIRVPGITRAEYVYSRSTVINMSKSKAHLGIATWAHLRKWFEFVGLPMPTTEAEYVSRYASNVFFYMGLSREIDVPIHCAFTQTSANENYKYLGPSGWHRWLVSYFMLRKPKYTDGLIKILESC